MNWMTLRESKAKKEYVLLKTIIHLRRNHYGLLLVSSDNKEIIFGFFTFSMCTCFGSLSVGVFTFIHSFLRILKETNDYGMSMSATKQDDEENETKNVGKKK